MDEQGQQALGLDVTPDEKTVLLTNDLSPEVAKEAVRRKASVIVSYRTSTPRPPSDSSLLSEKPFSFLFYLT